ncbi:MAG: D-glycerate dehydrogenase [Nitrososphaeria archaeon]
MKPKILITGPMQEKGYNLISRYFTLEGDIQKIMGRDDVLKALRDKDGLMLVSHVVVNSELLDAAPNLKVVSSVSVGFDHIDINETTKRGVYVCNTAGALTDCVAEVALELILSTYKRMSEAERFMRDRKWTRIFLGDEFLGRDVKGKVLGIVGLGRIGSRVAEIAKVFGMKVIYYDIIRPKYAEEMGLEFYDLNALMKASDIISIHIPLSNETRHLIDESKLKLMKKDAIIVNTSRGPIIEEKALIKALKEKTILGAGLDVFEEEPLPLDSELLRFENVVLSPHRGSASYETRAAMSELAARNLIAALSGEMPPALVNRDVLKVRPLSEIKMI